MSYPFSNASKVTYNPASKLFQYRDDLVKRAAEHSYRAYYDAVSKKAYKPCSAILEPAKESVRINMRDKGYSEDVIDSYASNIANELVDACEKHIFGVQTLAGLYNENVKARLAAKGGTRRRRRQTRYDVSRRARRARASASKSGM